MRYHSIPVEQLREIASPIVIIYNQIHKSVASDQKFVDFVIEQMDTSGQITYKKMFGEYSIYFDDKLFALICANKLYIKPTLSGRAYLKEVVEASPYPGAKPSFLIEEGLEDRDWLKELVSLTVKELPQPKPKKQKQKPK